jgi:hypothetical protein
MPTRTPWGAYVAATIGFLGLIFEIGLHAWTAIRHELGLPGDIYELNHAVFIGCMIVGGFGLYWIDPKRTEGSVDVFTRTVVAIGGMWRRTGSRSGDVVPVAVTGENVAVASVTPTKTDDERGQ